MAFTRGKGEGVERIHPYELDCQGFAFDILIICFEHLLHHLF